MQQDINKIVIAGAGQAGASAAMELRRAGFSGEVLLIGEEVHAPYERPQLSKELLKAGAAALNFMRDHGAYQEAGIHLELGQRIDHVDADKKQVALSDGSRHSYDRLLLATGVRPRPLSIDQPERIRYLRRVEDALALREDLAAGHSIAVVGGGVIGLEVASAAVARGCKVTLIESAERLMMRSVDTRIAAYLDRAHRARGVEIHYGAQVVDITEAGSVVLSDGTTICVDRVLVGIGVIPNVELVEHLGITDRFGVQVDAYGRTAIEEIYATGDIASQPGSMGRARVETWANAQDHAAAVARSLLGQQEPYTAPVWFWSDQGEINLQVVGNATNGQSVMRGDANGDAFSIFWLDDAHRISGCSSINSPKDMAMARRWIRQRAVLDPKSLANSAIPLRDCAAH
jgi:NADPH-dependent 2,4-dienoyl-CoA reductase/sulfur reductase-like enzyme